MKLSDYAWLCNKSYGNEIGWVGVDDLQFGVFELNGILRVCFRGSWNIENWLRDFDILPVKSSNGFNIHSGFEGAFQKIWPKLKPMLSKTLPIICGHSLGGAIAVRVGEEINCKEIITFGCPKVYLKGTGPSIKHTRIVCDDDPITEVPTNPYAHADSKIILLKSGNKCFNVESHFIGEYIDRLMRKGL